MNEGLGCLAIVGSIILAIFGFCFCLVGGTYSFIFSLFTTPNLGGFIIDMLLGGIFIGSPFILVPIGMAMLHTEDAERDEIE